MVSNKVIMKRNQRRASVKKIRDISSKKLLPIQYINFRHTIRNKSDIRYTCTLLTYYENDNVIFCSAKQLNVLIEYLISSITQLQYIASKHPDATFYQSVDFHLKLITLN